MLFNRFVQCGDIYQCKTNGMEEFVYSFGASNKRGSLFCVLDGKRVTGQSWSIPKAYATSFSLELVFEQRFDPNDIPF